MIAVMSGVEMSGVPMSMVRPESSAVLGKMMRLFAQRECLCGGKHCQHEAKKNEDGSPKGADAHPSMRGLSEECYRAFRSQLQRELAPSQRDPWERQQIRLGRIMWPRQGQGKRKKRQRKPEAVAAEVAAKANRRAKQRRRMERAAAKAKGGAA